MAKVVTVTVPNSTLERWKALEARSRGSRDVLDAVEVVLLLGNAKTPPSLPRIARIPIHSHMEARRLERSAWFWWSMAGVSGATPFGPEERWTLGRVVRELHAAFALR